MDKHYDVVVIGSCNVDLISYVHRFPKAGETICGSKFAMGCGGKGANQCVMAAKLGAHTAMIGCIGDDSFGDMYLKNFKSLQVNTDHLHVVKDMSTGVAPITVNSEGENSIVIVKGANDCLTKQHLLQAEELIRDSKVVLFQLEIDLDVTLSGIKLAKENKVTTIFNPAPAVDNLPIEFLQNSSILCCNETEAEILTKCNVSSVEECKQAVRTLLDMGPERVVLTLGAKGAMFGTKGNDDIQHVRPDESAVRKAVDTTGAGDCFVGTLAFCITKKPELEFKEMIRRAVDIASISVSRPGTQTSYPTNNELPDNLK